jgi:murein DD-endopeptidase MepM/ murein hydrolase activator NlpD
VGLLLVVHAGPVRALAAIDSPAIRITTAARSLRPGELVVVTLAADPNATDMEVSGFGKSIPAFRIDAESWLALIGIDLDQAPGAYTLKASARIGSTTIGGVSPLAILPRLFPTRTLRVKPDFVNPPPEVEERIEREAVLLRDVYANSSPVVLWEGPFVRPVPHAANGRFGARSVFNGEPRSPHAGTDFLSPEGTPIKAPNGGRIVVARDLFFSGNTVVVDHGLGVFSTLAHLSRIDVREGETIVTGRILGLVGATGRVTGPHLHWALRVADARVDPLSALALLADAPNHVTDRQRPPKL